MTKLNLTKEEVMALIDAMGVAEFESVYDDKSIEVIDNIIASIDKSEFTDSELKKINTLRKEMWEGLNIK